MGQWYSMLDTTKDKNSKVGTQTLAGQFTKIVGGGKGGQWACGFCPALDLRLLAHPALLLAK